ncbi:hypothetical protein FF1_034860 [Malus domestica]
MLTTRRLLDWRQCSLRGGSTRGYARCEAARFMVFLIASIYFMSTCTQYELILDMTQVRLSGSHIGSMCRIRGSGPQVGSLSRGHT